MPSKTQTIPGEPRRLCRCWLKSGCRAGWAGGQLSAPEPDLQRVVTRVGGQLLPEAPAGGPSASISDRLSSGVWMAGRNAGLGAGLHRRHCPTARRSVRHPPSALLNRLAAQLRGAVLQGRALPARLQGLEVLLGGLPVALRDRRRGGRHFLLVGGSSARVQAAATLLGIRCGGFGGGSAAMREQGELSPRHSSASAELARPGVNGKVGLLRPPSMSARSEIVNTNCFRSARQQSCAPAARPHFCSALQSLRDCGQPCGDPIIHCRRSKQKPSPLRHLPIC